MREICEAVREKRSVQVNLRNYRKNGEASWNRLLLGPVNGADGEPAYFFASQVDVTLERERMSGLENANAALIAELADRVPARMNVNFFEVMSVTQSFGSLAIHRQAV